MHDRPDESTILATCALRFDGYAFAEAAGLFNLIEDLVWENTNDPRVLNRARAEISRCVASRKVETGEWAKNFQPVPGATAWDFNARRAAPEDVNALLAEHAPPVYDPFCGGGSIPLEAQRLGLRVYASDLNPVPVLIHRLTSSGLASLRHVSDRLAVHPGHH
jgi:putative DNA methylase